jgi:hypothetical protein
LVFAFFAAWLDNAKWLGVETYILNHGAVACPLCHLSKPAIVARTQVGPHQQHDISGALPLPKVIAGLHGSLGCCEGEAQQRGVAALDQRGERRLRISQWEFTVMDESESGFCWEICKTEKILS